MNKIETFDGLNFFLSNFYPSPLKVAGKTFPTSEHAFQALKTFDEKCYEEIRTASSAGVAKKLGRKAPLRPDWESVKDEVMMMCLRAKFEDPHLRQALIDTEDRELIEGNTWGDKYWGVCDGVGRNRLGQLLMQLRKELNGHP
jgi:ribA/ribD-fused uncharacterized protein